MEEEDPGKWLEEPPVPAEPTITGVMVPEPVTVMGELQPLVGGVPGDASCPWSRLFHRGKASFSRRFVIQVAGKFTFRPTVGGTNTEPIKQGGVAGGAAFEIDLKEAGMPIEISFDYETRVIDVMDLLSGKSLLNS